MVSLSLERRYLNNHVDTECPYSNITCQYCAITGERQFIDGQHQEQCPKLPLPCPNGCDIGTVPRENMEKHKADCPLEMIQCDYYEVGCKDGVARKDQVRHNKECMENHLSLMKSEYLCTKRALKTAEENIKELEKAMEHRIKEVEIELRQKTQLIESMIFKNVFKWLEETEPSYQIPATLKMSEYSKRDDWYIASIIWKCGYFMIIYPVFSVYSIIQLRVVSAGCGNGNLSVQLYLVKGGRTSESSSFMPQGTRSLKEKIKMIPFDVMILNQISDNEHYSIQSNKVDIDTACFFVCQDCRVLIFDGLVPNEVLCRPTATCRYLHDDNIYFLVKQK